MDRQALAWLSGLVRHRLVTGAALAAAVLAAAAPVHAQGDAPTMVSLDELLKRWLKIVF